MKNAKPLPTTNKEWGFWGTCEQQEYPTKKLWDAASIFFIETFKLSPEQARELLDAKFGRHLVDDFSFIKSAVTAASVRKHLAMRLADNGWRKHFEKSIFEVLGINVSRPASEVRDELFTRIAQEHLNIETLVERKMDSLDFHDVGVLNIKAALAAAFEAGKAAAKGA